MAKYATKHVYVVANTKSGAPIVPNWVLIVTVGVVWLIHFNPDVVCFLWPCFNLLTIHLLPFLADVRTDDAVLHEIDFLLKNCNRFLACFTRGMKLVENLSSL